MPRFAANLSMLFGEVDFLSRFQAAAKAGFQGVEYLFPYGYDKQQLAELLDKHHLFQVMHNLPAGNWAAGERGIACLPDRVGEFQDGVGEAISYAKALGCRQLNVLAGIRPPRVDADMVQETLHNNLRFAAKALKAEGIKLLVEAVNTFDIPGFAMARTPHVLALIRDIGSDNLFVQYDIYHMQRMEGELAQTLQSQLQHIAHIQLADNPGRHEPGTGEINYPYLFGLLDRIGYQGWIGCEYKPKNGTVAGLGWLGQYL